LFFPRRKSGVLDEKKKRKRDTKNDTEKSALKLSLSALINAPLESGGVFFSVFSKQPREEDNTEETFGNNIIIIIQNGNDENHRNRANPGAFR
jgi:hypothetical protein